jgi:hypothetical protein
MSVKKAQSGLTEKTHFWISTGKKGRENAGI